jgi:adenylate kinase family enzyme
MRVLVIGPSGSGKTYIAEKLSAQAVAAVDADLIPGLSGWFDGQGKKVSFPPEADQEFLNTHQFLWDKQFLQEYLDRYDDLIVFGLSGNVFEMVPLFDKAFFLTVPDAVLNQRLQREDRTNPMGKTEHQRNSVIKFAKQLKKKAKKLQLPFIDGTKTPQEIYHALRSS